MRRTHRSPMAASLLFAALILAACTTAGGGHAPSNAAEAAALALAQQTRFAGIEARDDNLIGQAAWYEVTETTGGWDVVVRIGWGDCPAGCISEHRWTYAVARDGSVTLRGETGEPLLGGAGITGIASAGPTCPVETNPPDPACAERPVAGAVIVVTAPDGHEVARLTTDADGAFSVELAPGAYLVTPQPVDGLLGTPAAVEVTVAAEGPPTEVPLGYDTGIR